MRDFTLLRIRVGVLCYSFGSVGMLQYIVFITKICALRLFCLDCFIHSVD